jgi:hypothetical protein
VAISHRKWERALPPFPFSHRWVMNPMHECRGLCLASTATQKGDLSALASSTDTSGHHDKVPVHTQNLPSVQRSTLCAVLPWPRVFRDTTHQEPDTAQAGNARTVSPCGMHHPVCQKCLVRQQGALAHTYASTNVPGSQGKTPAGGANSSPWLEARRLLATYVEDFH